MNRNKAIITTCAIFITFLFLSVLHKIEDVAQQADNSFDEISETNTRLEDVSSEVNDIKDKLDM